MRREPRGFVDGVKRYGYARSVPTRLDSRAAGSWPRGRRGMRVRNGVIVATAMLGACLLLPCGLRGAEWRPGGVRALWRVRRLADHLR